MQLNALRSLTQPCMTAYCLYHNTYDPGISPGSATQCTLGDVYLRTNLLRHHTTMQKPQPAEMDHRDVNLVPLQQLENADLRKWITEMSIWCRCNSSKILLLA